MHAVGTDQRDTFGLLAAFQLERDTGIVLGKPGAA